MTIAIIPAAGSGVRMGEVRPKQFLDIDGRPILAITLMSFELCKEVDAIIVVTPKADVSYCQEEIIKKYNLTKVVKVVAGGERRQDSVRCGLEATSGNYQWILIHDGVRPIVSKMDIESVIFAAKTHRAVITGLPARETVKEVDDEQKVVCTHDRRRMWLIQTPQLFRYQDIMEAHTKALKEGWQEATDDSQLIERLGIPVKVIKGSERNIKVTTPNDLELARFLLRQDKDIIEQSSRRPPLSGQHIKNDS
jgi:2-C-methyl-D-erythritol 4-phosphate cytidylyltransferase